MGDVGLSEGIPVDGASDIDGFSDLTYTLGSFEGIEDGTPSG